MPHAVQPTVTAGEIVFELERFEHDGDRLAVTGRWFGVRGRRFVRPTLTPLGGADRSRVLADLEHKPWAAEDGTSWKATFPWTQAGPSAKFDLSVAPDITIQLPSPSAKRGSPRRLSAASRRPAVLSSTPSPRPSWDAPERVAPPAPPRDPEIVRLETELAAARAKLEAVLAELDESRSALADRERELEAAREQLAAAEAERDSVAANVADVAAARDHVAAEHNQLIAEREQLIAQRDQLQGHHDALASDRAQVITERDQLMIERDQLITEREQLRAGGDQLTGQLRQVAAERDQARQALSGLQAQLEQARLALDAANRARDEAIAARGAALVMRRAAGTPPHFERAGSWWKTALAVLALIGVMFAILIVVHVL